MDWDEALYRAFFRKVNGGFEPHDFQIRTARLLIAGRNIVITAPTGSGKTATILTPFLYPHWTQRPSRLIYALPLRTLAQSIYHTACEMVQRSGGDPDIVTLQTGEQSDDPFFDRGHIIVTTYDQVLSGLLAGPYGLSPKLHNVNTAALVGALVVLDEFHLMEPQRAFLTGAAGLYLFRELVQSVWMTATATSPLSNVLGEAINAETITLTEDELASLPSVAKVRRTIVWEPTPLLDSLRGQKVSSRMVVIVNTVDRAQQVFHELRQANPEVPSVLLHSRFFKSHRQEKEKLVRSLFGRGARGPALLVATQVVEAGIDISCDHLHTELAPMNALMQRAGRCARYDGECGTVHVHLLPKTSQSWLPYGDLRGPDGALLRTEELLAHIDPAGEIITPAVAGRWVEMVHGPDDKQAVALGWTSRLNHICQAIYDTAVLRRPQGIAHLIREPDTADRRVIISTAENLPERPGHREPLTLSRWMIARLIEDGTAGDAWVWDEGGEPGWRPLERSEQLAGAFTVALSPAIVCYSRDYGLKVGEPGTTESPDREEPPRPGHRPLRAEGWEKHTRLVAAEAVRRWEHHGGATWLAQAFTRRYGLSPRALRDAVEACGLLHDLGKLQQGWQEWAAAAQQTRDPTYRHVEPLAHTDFDPDDPADRRRVRELSAKRPPHAAASAYLGCGVLAELLGTVPSETRTVVASACAAAVLAHHGGWLPSEHDLGLQKLWSGAVAVIEAVFGPVGAKNMIKLVEYGDRRSALAKLLDQTMSPDTFQDWWPLVAVLIRTLRLADQRATSEANEHE